MGALAAVKQLDGPDGRAEWAASGDGLESARSKDPTSPQPVSTTPTLCACGCGEPVNPLLDRIRELRNGRQTFVAIGAELGIDAAYARVLHRRPPRFVKGHSARTAVWVALRCDACGREFKTTSESGRTFCNGRYCPGSGLGKSVHKQFVKRLDILERQRRTEQRSIIRVERRLWTVQDHREARQRERERRQMARMLERARQREERALERERLRAERIAYRERERQRERVRREVRRHLGRGGEMPWHVRVPRGRLLSLEERAELDNLLAEQAIELGRSERGWGERRRGSVSPSMTRSLDAAFFDGSEYSLADSLTDLSAFTSSGDLERMMVGNGVRNLRRGLIVTTGERGEVEWLDAA